VARPIGAAELDGEVMVEAAGVDREGTEISEVGLDGWEANTLPGLGLGGWGVVPGAVSALLSCSPLRLAACFWASRARKASPLPPLPPGGGPPSILEEQKRLSIFPNSQESRPSLKKCIQAV